MGLTVKVVDLNRDGKNEIILGTGQESGETTAYFYLFNTDGTKITKKIVSQSECNKSSFTHNFAIYDLDKDGLDEVISAYCGGGEIIRYDVDKRLSKITARKLYQLSGSGEESIIADVDNDGKNELVLSTRGDNHSEKIGSKHLGHVLLYKIDENGEIHKTLLVDFNEDKAESSWLAVGDADNDGKNEIILATGRGDRTKPGISYLVLIEKK